MDCWHCRKTAIGACRFCGRGICQDHVETLPYVIELFGRDVTKALVVEDALYCGACTPRPDPLELPELDRDTGAGMPVEADVSEGDPGT